MTEFFCPECKQPVCPPNIYCMAQCFACHIAFETNIEEEEEDSK